MKVAVQTLGCKVNQSESASIKGLLRDHNHDVVNQDQDPDVFIINTCTVTARSDYQSRQLIRRAVRTGAKVIATGCYAQVRPDELSRIEGLDIIVGNAEKSNIFNYLNGISNENRSLPHKSTSPDFKLKPLPYHSDRARAFLKIQDGCNFSCSYCTVPMARGKNRSLSINEVLSSVEEMVINGYREIVLTGIHIGSYGVDLSPKCSLYEIIRKVTDSFPQIRLRLSSIEPHEFSFELIPLIKKNNVCAHLHIPLQSGSDKILKLMKRGYDTDFYKQLINKISTLMPDVSIGTDIITGFPCETESDFKDTVNFLNDLPITYMHVFRYSKRPKTAAASLTDQVNNQIKKKRVKILMDISKSKKNHFIKNNLGKIVDVIVEKKDLNNRYFKAISSNYLKLYIDSNDLRPGERLKARLNFMKDNLLFAKLID